MAVVFAQHNIPLAIMVHLSPLFRDIFPDSKIAEQFSAARTKTICIMNMALLHTLKACQLNEIAMGYDSIAHPPTERHRAVQGKYQKSREIRSKIQIFQTQGLISMHTPHTSSHPHHMYTHSHISLLSFMEPWQLCLH